MGKMILNGKEYAGSGGGSSSLADLEDVNISSPSDGQVLRYDDESGKWVNANMDISPFSVVDGKVCITFTEAQYEYSDKTDSIR